MAKKKKKSRSSVPKESGSRSIGFSIDNWDVLISSGYTPLSQNPEIISAVNTPILTISRGLRHRPHPAVFTPLGSITQPVGWHSFRNAKCSSLLCRTILRGFFIPRGVKSRSAAKSAIGIPVAFTRIPDKICTPTVEYLNSPVIPARPPNKSRAACTQSGLEYTLV